MHPCDKPRWRRCAPRLRRLLAQPDRLLRCSVVYWLPTQQPLSSSSKLLVSSNGIENPDKQLACQRAPIWDFFAQSATCVVFRRPPQCPATGVLLIRHSLCFKNEAMRGLEFGLVALLTATWPWSYVRAFV